MRKVFSLFTRRDVGKELMLIGTLMMKRRSLMNY